jgi:hypothetical protein
MGELVVNDRLYQEKRRPSGGCLLWTGNKDRDGYGLVSCRRDGRRSTIGAHRYALFREGHDIAGLVVRHRCHTPACVNPEHLDIGSHADNVQDRDSAGRQAKGSRINRSKLRERDIPSIRADQRSSQEVALDYGVQTPAINKIRRRATWAHVS